MQTLPSHGVPALVYGRQNQTYIADRGAVVHALLKLVLEQHRWLMDLDNPFQIEAELEVLVETLHRRHLILLTNHPDARPWVTQGLRELLVWLAKRKPRQIQAEPLLPFVPLGDGRFLTQKSPDIQFVMHDDFDHMLSEVKTGRGGERVMEYKLIKYGIAYLLDQHQRGNPLEYVHLRWLGFRFPGEFGVPKDCQQVLSVRKRKLKLEGADRWLRRHYGVGFEDVRPQVVPVERYVPRDPGAWWTDYKTQLALEVETVTVQDHIL